MYLQLSKNSPKSVKKPSVWVPGNFQFTSLEAVEKPLSVFQQPANAQIRSAFEVFPLERRDVVFFHFQKCGRHPADLIAAAVGEHFADDGG